MRIDGVDVFHPEGIACRFVDTDDSEESFFVRQACLVGASDPSCKAPKTTLKAEIDPHARAILQQRHHPSSGRIAVKVINHLGDETKTSVPGVTWAAGQRLSARQRHWRAPGYD